MRSYWSGSTSSADQDQEVALSVFKGSLAAGSTILMHKCRAGSNCNFGPDLVCSSSQRFQLLLHIWRPQGDHEQGLFKISGWSCSSGTRTVLSGSVLSNEWKFCLHISSHTWRSSNVCVPNVRIDAILMNSEIIFLSKQIEQVDITDPSINQRGKTNKPSVKKLECFFCSLSSRMWVQQCNDKGEHSADDKRVMLTAKEVSPEEKRLPQHQGQQYLGTTSS